MNIRSHKRCWQDSLTIILLLDGRFVALLNNRILDSNLWSWSGSTGSLAAGHNASPRVFVGDESHCDGGLAGLNTYYTISDCSEGCQTVPSLVGKGDLPSLFGPRTYLV